MIRLYDIRYLRIGTTDLDSAIEFATRIVGLQLVGREGKAAYFRSDKVGVRGDTRDHTLVYFEGDPADHTSAFDILDRDDFDRIGAELENAGHAVHYGTPEECELRRVRQFIAFKDPTGNKHEVVVRPHHCGPRYFPSRDAGITHFSHIGLRTSDAPRDEAFWTRLLNARVSDWIGDAPLLRINTIHHTLALFPSHAIPGCSTSTTRSRTSTTSCARTTSCASRGCRSCSVRGGIRRRRRASSISRGTTRWCTSTRWA